MVVATKAQTSSTTVAGYAVQGHLQCVSVILAELRIKDKNAIVLPDVKSEISLGGRPI